MYLVSNETSCFPSKELTGRSPGAAHNESLLPAGLHLVAACLSSRHDCAASGNPPAQCLGLLPTSKSSSQFLE